MVAALGAGFARYKLNPLWGPKVTFITFYPAVALASWLGGIGPGLAATAVSVVCALLFLPPVGSLEVENPPDLVALALFITVNLFISTLSEGLHRARRRAEVARDATRHSEERLRGIVASATDAIITINADQKITLFNAGAESIFGYSSEEMIGRTLDPLIPERFREIHRRHIETFGATGVGTREMGGERVLAGLRRSGEEFPMEARISQIEIAGEKLYTVILRDITARKRAEQVRDMYVRMLDAGFDAIIVRDARDRITSWNRGATDLYGWTRDEALGQVTHALFQTKFPKPLDAILADLLRDARWEGELIHTRKDGSVITVLSRWTLERDAEGQRASILETNINITPRKRAEAEREELLASAERARAEAEAASDAKDAFLATVSHELRTPLSPILAWSRMLRQGRLDAENTAKAIETIERSARSQAQLIEDLLDVSRIVAGKLRLDVRPVELASVVQAAVDVLRPAADAKGIRLQTVLDPEAGQVSGDPERLQQVVWNLLANAVKFTSKGGRVQVVLERVNSHVEIAVSDTGQGISPDFLPHVFERFQQDSVGPSRAHAGLGLGLAIVRHIVEMHGGTVHAESPGVGRGAVFTVKLPLIVIARTAGEAERRHPLAVQDAATDHGYPSLAGLRILVVDDEPDSNEVVRALLASCGAEVRVAASAEQAREVLRRWRIELLVSDVGMPGEDGYALIASLRAQAGEQLQLPAVALTAYASREDKIRLLSAGFQAHVPKPLDPAELVTVVASVARSTGKL